MFTEVLVHPDHSNYWTLKETGKHFYSHLRGRRKEASFRVHLLVWYTLSALEFLVIRVVLNWLCLRKTMFNSERWDSHELGYSQSSVWVSSSLFQKNCQCESTTDDAVMMGLVSPSGKLLCFSLSHRFWTSLVHLEQQNPLSPAPLKKRKCKSQGKGDVPVQGS